ncbi:hypothetical protein EJ08DRAFT_675974 [Tothia fuscella]|uniref:Uncharacterized protein n=1 Tax=Tothia fuscella TaxID=1048955 RepID=A0A9P4NY04_9PEZI|nr:hypothetical protein EJ08DRAFT_675974 [Tothia fuscella]
MYFFYDSWTSQILALLLSPSHCSIAINSYNHILSLSIMPCKMPQEAESSDLPKGHLSTIDLTDIDDHSTLLGKKSHTSSSSVAENSEENAARDDGKNSASRRPSKDGLESQAIPTTLSLCASSDALGKRHRNRENLRLGHLTLPQYISDKGCYIPEHPLSRHIRDGYELLAFKTLESGGKLSPVTDEELAEFMAAETNPIVLVYERPWHVL